MFVNSVVMRVFFVLSCALIFAVCVILVFGGCFPGFGCGYCAEGWFGVSVVRLELLWFDLVLFISGC